MCKTEHPCLHLLLSGNSCINRYKSYQNCSFIITSKYWLIKTYELSVFNYIIYFRRSVSLPDAPSRCPQMHSPIEVRLILYGKCRQWQPTFLGARTRDVTQVRYRQINLMEDLTFVARLVKPGRVVCWLQELTSVQSRLSQGNNTNR